MKAKSSFSSLLILSLFSFSSAFAQDSYVISGTVVDATNGQGIAFSSIGLKKQLIGIVSNEMGNFDLISPIPYNDDTLFVVAFGYTRAKIVLSTAKSPLTIRLKPAPVLLQEVDIIPLSPELYIRMAMRKAAFNYPSQPFESLAYYREKLLENKAFIKMEEGIFKTYCANYQDTTKNQNQLVLFRKAEDTKDISFMSEEQKKKKKKEKADEKKPDGNEVKVEGKHVELDMASSFGGPEEIFKSSKIKGESFNFLDTLHLKKYKYTFAKAGSGDLLVIEFKSKGKVDHVRESGTIFIDPLSFAIVKIENTGEVVIPFYIQPILFLYSIGIEDPTFIRNVEFEQVKNNWYPRNIHMTIDIHLTRRHMFSKNEHAFFEIEQVYTVNRLTVENPKQISVEKRYKSSKKMEEQVFNDENLKWETVNIIKK